MSRFLVALLILVAFSETGHAQRRGSRSGSGSSAGRLQIQDSSDRRQDVEGTIWEFKVIDTSENNRSKQTKSIGRFRIKQTSIFAVGEMESLEEGTLLLEDVSEVMKRFDTNGDKVLSVSELEDLLEFMRDDETGLGEDARRDSRVEVKSELGDLFSQRIKQAKEQDTRGERIGDLTKNTRTEMTFRFDEDDAYPISGIVVVQYDSERKNGTWVGRYDEFADGKRKQRWRFEMRKIEE